MHIKWYVDIGLMLVAFVAAVIDTIAGGGGLITIPALLVCGINPVLALGTIKLQASVAEFSATLYFLRKAKIDYRVLLFLALYTVIFAALGVVCLIFMPLLFLEKLVPFLLLFILLYYITTLRRKDTHLNHVIEPSQKKFLVLGSMVGFYNGFFGPGTGSIWAILLMKVFKLNLQRATMYAKPLNFIGNFSAFGVFFYNHDIIFFLAFLMSAGAFAGALLGGKIVLYQDVRILKLIFLLVMLISVTSTFIKFYA